MKYPKVRLITPADGETLDIDITKLVDFKTSAQYISMPNGASICNRGSGNLYNKGLFLPLGYTYKVVADSEGYPVLIALKD